jgi:hypothetical protein
VETLYRYMHCIDYSLHLAVSYSSLTSPCYQMSEPDHQPVTSQIKIKIPDVPGPRFQLKPYNIIHLTHKYIHTQSMPPLLPEAEAGPSKKRISTFKSHSEGESDYEEEEPIVKRKKSKLNGHSEKRQKINGISNGDKGDKRRKLEKRAGELLEMRQDLPFYQGAYLLLERWEDGGLTDRAESYT